MPLGADQQEQSYRYLIDEIKTNFDSDVKQVTEQVYLKLSGAYTRDETNPKFVVAYLYDDDLGASFDFRALSTDRWLKDDFVFFAIDSPSNLMAHTNEKLPLITGIFRETEKHPPGSAFHFNGQTEIQFLSTKLTLMSLVPGLREKFDKHLKEKFAIETEVA